MKLINPVKLLTDARTAANCAYAPYSKYRVGAALLTADDTIFTGCNVENSSYGLTICAERVAIFSAISAGKRKFKALAIVSKGKKSPSPCGACRQVLAEFSRNIPIYFASASALKKFRCIPSADLLPESFKL
ncbi:MAG: cytidine deaminase [Lentisphaerae bacterium RIFOXYA12_FULL_48_11]|nr:MAG: cytidine deaminase [Lentisphaerae bacterium RIFOXYA12_FULL_48_11]